jgi:site-specific DNA-methyltransferase (adenine-specific)
LISIVHQLNNRLFLKGQQDNAFPLVIDDPPYGIFSEKKKTGFLRDYATQAEANKWDQRPESKYFQELFRVSKNQIIWGAQYFTNDLPDYSQPIIWDKKTGESYFSDGEMAFCSFPGTLRIIPHQWAGCFRDSERGEKSILAGQKPVAVYEWLLKTFAKKGWVILDPHTGSGSLRLACYHLGFDYVGCENNESRWQAQEERFQNYVRTHQIYKGRIPFGLKETGSDPFGLKNIKSR